MAEQRPAVWPDRMEFSAFATLAKEHWKTITGGSSVFLLVGWLLSVGIGIPKWVVVLGVFFFAVALASFLAWLDEHREKNILLGVRRTKADECYERTIEFLKGFNDKPKSLVSFHALYSARAYELEDSEQLESVCNRIEMAGFHHPFLELGDEWILKSERLEFLKWGHSRPGLYLNKKGDYIHAAACWAEQHGRSTTTGNTLARQALALWKFT